MLLAAATRLPPPAQAAAIGAAVDAALESADLDFARLLILQAEQLRGYDLDPLLRLHLDRARCAVAGAAGDFHPVPVLRRAIDGLDHLHAAATAATWLALGTACCDIGDLARARRHFVTAAAYARVQGDLPLLVDALAGETFAEHALGGWSTAYAAGTRALELMDADRAPYLLADLAQLLAEIDAARGAEDLCRQRCAQVRGLAARLGLWQLAVRAERREALLDLGLNRLDAAADRLQQVREQNEAMGLRHPYLSPVPDLVEVYVRAGRPAEAARLVPEFAAVVGPGAPAIAQARLLRTRALVAGDGGYRDLFEESVRLDADGGHAFLRARTLLCYGERLRRDRERVAARAALRTAVALFDRLEATPWSHRTRVELAATGETVTSSSAGTGHLTPQELQIAVLVGEGQRNKDIAATLFLSVRTVEFHLTRVYRKLAVGTRAELAARLARRELTGAP